MDTESLRVQLGDFYQSCFSDITIIEESWEIIFYYLQSAAMHNLHDGNLFSPDVWEFLISNEGQYSYREAINPQSNYENYQIGMKPYLSPCEELRTLIWRDKERMQYCKEDYGEVLREIAKCCLKNKYSANPLAIFRAFYKHLRIGFGIINVADTLTQVDFFQNHEAISVFAIFSNSIYYLSPKVSISRETIKSLFVEKLIIHSNDGAQPDKMSQLRFNCGCRYDIFEILDLTSTCRKCNQKFYKYEVDLVKRVKEKYDLNKQNQKRKEKKKNNSQKGCQFDFSYGYYLDRDWWYI